MEKVSNRPTFQESLSVSCAVIDNRLQTLPQIENFKLLNGLFVLRRHAILTVRCRERTDECVITKCCAQWIPSLDYFLVHFLCGMRNEVNECDKECDNGRSTNAKQSDEFFWLAMRVWATDVAIKERVYRTLRWSEISLCNGRSRRCVGTFPISVKHVFIDSLFERHWRLID
jgi:hypothetical protein